MISRLAALSVLALAVVLAPESAAQVATLSPGDRVLAREVFKELIETPTSEADAATPRAAQPLADRLVGAGVKVYDAEAAMQEIEITPDGTIPLTTSLMVGAASGHQSQTGLHPVGYECFSTKISRNSAHSPLFQVVFQQQVVKP